MNDKIKVETRKVTKPAIITEETIYITTDDKEYKHQWEADKHQNSLDAELILTNMKVVGDWWLIESKEQMEALLLVEDGSLYLLRSIYKLPVWIKLYDTVDSDGDPLRAVSQLRPYQLREMLEYIDGETTIFA